MIGKAIIIALALGIVGNAALDKGVHEAAVHERSTPVPSCLVTGLGAKLCDADARAWCDAISSRELEGRGTDHLHFENEVPEDSADACASVGWTG